MPISDTSITRKEALRGLIILPALAGLAGTGVAGAAATGSKSQFKYQSTPNNGKQCSQCTFYIPGSSSTANGTCKIVAGSISPKGWCTAFSPKSH
jgi:hypothetical protein